MSNASEPVPKRSRPPRRRRNVTEDARPHRFFISYRHSENDSEEVARALSSGLESAGFEVFIDTGISIGTNWVEEITLQIDKCDSLVVLLSEGARTSEMVQGEVRLAHRRRKRDGKPAILPVRIRYEGTLDYELDSYLGRLQYVLWNSQSDTETILRSIVSRTGETSHVVDVSTPTPPVFTPPPHDPRPKPRVDPRSVMMPGGSVSYRDPFYIERAGDATVLAAAAASTMGTTLVIKGPRMMGKSSMLLRYCAEAQAQKKDVSFLSLAEFSDAELSDYPQLLGAMADHFTQALGAEPPATPPTTQRQLTKFIEQKIIARKPGEIVLAFDEVDRVLGRPFQNDFFYLFRLWHNNRAALKGWERVSIALVISTEPYLLIKSADLSPFNVAPPVVLTAFTLADCARWNDQYGSPLDRPQLEDLHELLSGQPYLTRLAFYRMSGANAMTFAKFDETAADPDGPLGDHLRALLLKLNQLPELLESFTRLIVNSTEPSQEVTDRLAGAGLVVRRGTRVIPANMVYARFFKRVLK
jgi:hypothetical protein